MRVDTGVRQGDTITPHYDPMIAKLIVWGEDRAVALGRMRAALADYEIVGVATNVEFLARTVAGKAFSSADLDTGLIERNRAELFPADAGASDEELAAAALAELLAEQAQAAAAAGTLRRSALALEHRRRLAPEPWLASRTGFCFWRKGFPSPDPFRALRIPA